MSLEIDFTSDWHLGHSGAEDGFPTLDDIRASLNRAMEREVAAYVIAGDFVDRGQTHYAHVAADMLKSYIERGLLVIGVVGNHDFKNGSSTDVTEILSKSGVVMLEGESCVVSKNGKTATILGISGEVGPEHDSWWRREGWNEEGRREAYKAGAPHRAALKKGLEEVTTDTVVVVTHRGIVSETVGTKARETGFVPTQTQDFAHIIDGEVRRRGLQIFSASGHYHGNIGEGWEGFSQGMTEGGVLAFNVAAPVRRRLGKPLEKRLFI